MNNSVIFILLLIICFYFILTNNNKKNNNKKNTENFKALELPSFKKFLKYSKGYSCDPKLDGIPLGLQKEYDVKTFCDENPAMNVIGKLTTKLVKGKDVKISKGHKTFSSKDLNVNKTFSGLIKKTGNNLFIKKTEKNNKELNLTKDEALSECLKDITCSYVAIGNLKGKKLGTSLIYNGPKENLTPGITKNRDYDLFEKIYNIEYSIVLWLKIDKKIGSERNIFHHGNSKSDMNPSLNIKPDSTGLLFSLKTSAGIKGGEKINIPGGSIVPGQWAHVAISVFGKKIAAYVGGNEVINSELAGFPVWPKGKKVFVSSPYSGSGGFSLSTMEWFPFQLSKEFIENLSTSTTPTNKVDKSTKDLPGIDKSKIVLQNGWKEDKKLNYTKFKVEVKLGVAFLDGFIKCNKKAGINQTCGILPDGTFPDRLIVTTVGTIGGNILRLMIYPNGNINLFDGKSKFGAGIKHNYQLGDSVILSNVRYPLIGGNAVKLRNGVTNETNTGYPSFFSLGSLVFLTGGMSNVNNKWFCQLPMGKRPPVRGIYLSNDHNGNPGRIDITSKGWCLANRSGPSVSLEGINFSTMKGVKLLLYSGFKNFNPDKFEEARVVLDNGIVKVSGLIALFYSKFNANKINKLGCYRDNESDKDLPFKSGSGMNEISCAKSAFKQGHTYFALNKKVCSTGMNYGKYGKTACNSSNANEVFTLDSEWVPILRLPKGYRPKNHLSFLCVTDSVGGGKPGGTATVNVNKNGWVHLLKKINTKSELLSLNNILFFV